MRVEAARRLMKKFVFKSVVCGRSKETRWARKKAKGPDERSIGARDIIGWRRSDRAALRADGNRCACCLKLFLIDRGVMCSECGARICKSHCSRLEPRQCDCWCCLFCYQQRVRLFRNPRWLSTDTPYGCRSQSMWDIEQPSICTGRLANDATCMARTALRKLVDRTVDEVCKLSNLENSPSNDTCDDQLDVNDELALPRRNYDDLLKMIIVNKVIEKSRCERFNKNNNVSNFKLTNDLPEVIPCGQNCNSTVKEISQTEIDNKCDEEAYKFTQTRNSLTIEEKMEELPNNSDEDSKSECDNYPNIYKFHRVPFPELGMDIIDPNQISEEGVENEIDDLEYTKVIGLVDSWKDNWLFRKKNFKQYSKFVSMFVPNANTEYRAMIGDKDIDETSDLSEYLTNSDEDPEIELTLPLENESLANLISDDCNAHEKELIHSKLELNDIDGTESAIISKNHVSNSINDEAMQTINSDVSTPTPEIRLTNTSSDEENVNASEKKISATVKTSSSKELEFPNDQSNSHTMNETTIMEQNSSQIINVENQQDDVHTEQDVLVRESCCKNMDNTIENSPSKLKKLDRLHNIGTNGKIQVADQRCLSRDKENSAEIQFNVPPKPGSIAEREHKKWESATSIKNNPYSKENIQKRLLEKKYMRPSNLSRFSGDYCVDNPIISNEKTKELVESDILNKTLSDINCDNSNSNKSNLEIQQNIEVTQSNSSISKALVLTTNSKKHYNKSTSHTNSNATDAEILQAAKDEITTSSPTKNNKIFEHEGKNKKNEIHAKLNNQDRILDGVNDEVAHSNQPLCNENPNRPIREMDLKAYVFEKSDLPKMLSNSKSTQQQDPNKLDTNNASSHLDSSIVNNPLLVHELSDKACKGIGLKSNLMNKEQSETVGSLGIKTNIDDDFLLDNRTKDNVIPEKDMSVKLTSVKSAPRKVLLTCNRQQIIDNELTECKNEMIRAKMFDEQDFVNDEKNEKYALKTGDNLPDDVKANQINKSFEDFPSNGEIGCNNNCIERKLSMPSVKQLVQVFDRKYQETITSNLMAESKSSASESRGIKSVQGRRSLSRQLHSLTARSLSKEFREGLRQIPNKARVHDLKPKKLLQ